MLSGNARRQPSQMMSPNPHHKQNLKRLPPFIIFAVVPLLHPCFENNSFRSIIKTKFNLKQTPLKASNTGHLFETIEIQLLTFGFIVFDIAAAIISMPLSCEEQTSSTALYNILDVKNTYTHIQTYSYPIQRIGIFHSSYTNKINSCN